jgi:hypothetical protein
MSAVKWIRFAVLSLFSVLFFWLFYIRYWKYRDCIGAAKSSCVTPEGDNLISAGVFWIVPAVVFACFALWTLRRRPSVKPRT